MQKDQKLNISDQDLNKSDQNLNLYENKSKNLSEGYYVYFVVMIVIIVSFQMSNEVNTTYFLTATLEKSKNLKLNQQDAAKTFAILQTVITIARFLNIFLSFKVNAVANLYFNFAAMMSGIIMLVIYLSKSLFYTKIGISLLGLGQSSTYPLLIAFVEQRITLTNRVSSIMSFSSVFGLSVSPLVIGSLIDDNPNSFVYITLFVTIVTISVFTKLYFMEVLRLRRLKL